MKNTVKKAIALSAGLAGAAVMVSCEGDDVTVREVTTSVDTTGLEAAVAANNGDLLVEAPSAALFSISTLSLSIGSDVGPFLGGAEYKFEFDSTSFGSVRSVNVPGSALESFGVDTGPLLNVSNWVSGGRTLTMDIDAPMSATPSFGGVDFDGVNLMFVDSRLNTLLGTWTAQGGSTTTVDPTTDVVFDNADNTNLVAASETAGGTPHDDALIQGFRMEDANAQIPFFRSSATAVGTGERVEETEEALLYNSPALGRVVFIRLIQTSGTPALPETPIIVTAAELDAIIADRTNPDNFMNANEIATDQWQLVAVSDVTAQVVSGSFSMDIEASNGQVATDNANQ